MFVQHNTTKLTTVSNIIPQSVDNVLFKFLKFTILYVWKNTDMEKTTMSHYFYYFIFIIATGKIFDTYIYISNYVSKL